jgi:DNA replication licensing factor MCM4
LKTRILNLVDSSIGESASTITYEDLQKKLAEGSSIVLENLEFGNAIRSLEQEGRIVIQGSGSRRTIRKVSVI